jgi:hypothetical protein
LVEVLSPSNPADMLSFWLAIHGKLVAPSHLKAVAFGTVSWSRSIRRQLLWMSGHFGQLSTVS